MKPVNSNEHGHIWLFVWKLKDGKLIYPAAGGTRAIKSRIKQLLPAKKKQFGPPPEPGASLVAVRRGSISEDDWANKPEVDMRPSRAIWLDYVEAVLERCQQLAIGRSLYEEVGHE